MTDSPQTEETTTETTEEPATGDTDLSAEVARWKKLARQNEAQAKANAEAAKKLAELEERDKTESQRIAEQAAADKARADQAERELLLLRVASRKGLTESQAKWLRAAQVETEDELEAAAEELRSSFAPPASDDTPDIPSRPRERLKPGASPSAEPEETDPRKLAANLPR